MLTKQDFERKLVKKYNQIHTSAKDRKIDCTLTLAKLRRLLTAKTCYYTGVILTDDGGPNQRSIDRVDSDGIYEDNNVVPCCARINSLKGSASLKDFCDIINGMKRHNLRNAARGVVKSKRSSKKE